MQRFVSKLPAFLAAASALTAAANAAALPPPTPVTLLNPSFDIPTLGTDAGEPVSTLAMCPVAGAVGASGSESWTTYGNTAHTSITSWREIGPDGYKSNLVSTGGGQNGLVQVLSKVGGGHAPQGTVTDVNRVSAWVYVIAGQAEIQLGDGGSGGGMPGVSSLKGQWEYISACGRGDMRNNEVTVYGVGPAIFYVDDASISYDPSCAAVACPSCSTCPHPPHVTGEPLSSTCSTCEATVCGLDPFCCTTAWDGLCVTEAMSNCP